MKNEQITMVKDKGKDSVSKEMRKHIMTVVKAELIAKRCNKDDAEDIAKALIAEPDKREGIIEEWELESLRICEHCGKLMHEGYMVDDCCTYCSKECVMQDTGWSKEEFDNEIAVVSTNPDNTRIYYTSWEG